MKTRSVSPRSGFTLIELIGVMAILSILAAVITPNVLRSLALAEAKTETQTLSNFSAQLKTLTGTSATMPTTVNWTTLLQPYMDTPLTSLVTNHQGRTRVLLIDPTAANQRGILLSVMSTNTNLVLPTSAQMNTTSFQVLWDTPYDSVPKGAANSGWAGWDGWTTTNVAGASGLIVIQRINFMNDLLTYSAPLNNSGTVAVKYVITRAGGSAGAPITINAGAQAVPVPTFHRGDRVDLYATTAAATPQVSYIFSDSIRTFTFSASNVWQVQ